MAPTRLMDVGRILDAAEAASPLDAVASVARELGAAYDAVSVSFLITDMSGRALVRLAHVPLVAGATPGLATTRSPLEPGERRRGEESATYLPFDGGPEEQAVRTQTVQVLAAEADAPAGAEGLWRVLAPVTERGEAIGLLELYLRERPAPEVVAEIGQVAHLLAFVVIANRQHTDLFEWGQRNRSFSLSAEIQQRLLPQSRTCEAAAFTLAGWLEPAASIGGDTFDYSLGRNVLHLSLTDAMGHGVGAALTASLCLGGLRGGRRRGQSLLEQVASTNAALLEHAVSENSDFVTGLVGRLDLRTGSLALVNAGHVAPYLLRGDELTTLDLRANLPLGLFADAAYDSTEVVLQPGDRLVLVTDGMLERHVASVDLPGAIRATRDLHPREVVRALADSALAAAGHALEDDATLLCLDWHGTHDEDRDAVDGADTERASDPLDERSYAGGPAVP
ncbi:serine/threonine-protein phosphatase [Nocardioides sp. KIGAM211]|uniref:Serine/threonine-protein phosphatase n=1 Tax=Nocardioides luti TaxID=2761101 RepID=A0A7X0RHG4_9ACTN|nr:PP2C family protein-serine/threonine phosphatase [Nocardioides luti]MBB6628225.1 serine/threonine-protein phosphatase [Nocardioides luti]